MSCPRLAATCAIAILSITVRLAGQAQGTRVDSLLRAMTLDEKLGFLHGAPDPEPRAGAGYVPGVPRLGIPPGDGRVRG